MSDFEAVILTRDLGPGDLAEVQAHGRTLALSNLGQTYYAVDAICPLDGTNLARDGRVQGEQVHCPLDHSVYDLKTGEAGEEGRPGLQRYAIKVEGNEVMVGPAL